MKTITIKDNLFGDAQIGPHDIEIRVNLRDGETKGVKILWETIHQLQDSFPQYTQEQLIMDAYKKAVYELIGK